ncbi:MAG: UpxY family transcription antiterminator, partial [Cytophagales bacterium]|nr:UpxY family transcription antiterminator [Cytophagales bacterium]
MTKQDNWYVVYTYPNSEKKIYNELSRREISAFLPTKKVTRQWSDRKKNIDVPLFPNYLFVKVNSSATWQVLLVNGVVKYITCNGAPAVVKQKEIDWIRQLQLGCNPTTNDAFNRTGEKVQVKRGPLTGMVGKVAEKKGTTRLYVELETLNQTVSVDIDAALLE